MSQNRGSPIASRQPPGRFTAFQFVRDDAALRLNADRCLRLRSRYSDCDQCARACPPRVLHVSQERIELADGCLRCGQCSAACPTEALQMEGFPGDPPRAVAIETPLHVDCWKVAACDSPRDALRVPCLGGIALHHLVRWHAACEGRPILLLDRGWCGECSAGSGTNHPAQEALDAARVLLAELGVAEPALPRFQKLPLPGTRMPAEIPDSLAAQPLNRREFFSGMTRAAARAIAPVVAGEGSERPPTGGTRLGTIEATARSQLLAQADVLAKRHERTLPAELFPAIRVSDACRNHQVCAGACPTGALQTYANGDGTAAGIAFDAAACIACGDCTRVCPERALALIPQGDGERPHGTTVLTQWTLRECHGCGHEFADSGSGNVCPACRKTRDLGRDLFGQLFAPARERSSERI